MMMYLRGRAVRRCQDHQPGVAPAVYTPSATPTGGAESQGAAAQAQGDGNGGGDAKRTRFSSPLAMSIDAPSFVPGGS